MRYVIKDASGFVQEFIDAESAKVHLEENHHCYRVNGNLVDHTGTYKNLMELFAFYGFDCHYLQDFLSPYGINESEVIHVSIIDGDLEVFSANGTTRIPK